MIAQRRILADRGQSGITRSWMKSGLNASLMRAPTSMISRTCR